MTIVTMGHQKATAQKQRRDMWPGERPWILKRTPLHFCSGMHNRSSVLRQIRKVRTGRVGALTAGSAGLFYPQGKGSPEKI